MGGTIRIESKEGMWYNCGFMTIPFKIGEAEKPEDALRDFVKDLNTISEGLRTGS